jgi:ABC-type multidrug transport system ATPase subunit
VSAIISVENISKKFGNHLAVDNLSLQIAKGEIYGFLGPNGSGKSTTLRMMLGLLNPSGGNIFINGKSLSTQRSSIMQHIGCIIEKPDFYTYLSAQENLELFGRMSGISDKKSIASILEKVGLTGREKDKVKTYSHGMKQRLGLAQALLHNPEIIILDEPNTGLDPQGIIELRNTIVQLNKEEGKTIVISSHILPEIEDIADSMILIHNGKTIAQGKIKELLNEREHIVTIEVKDALHAKQKIEQSEWKQFIQSEKETKFEFHLQTHQIPSLNNWLVQNQIDIYQLSKMRALENYFLQLTSNKA